MVVLVVERYPTEELVPLKVRPDLTVHHEQDITELKKHWPQCEALLIRSKTHVSRALLKDFPQLKVIITATSGFDHIDLEAAKEKNIVVMHTPEANANSAAELALTLMFNLSRSWSQAQKQVSAGHWQRRALVGQEVARKKLGLIGLGRVGSLMAQKAQALGLKVVAHDPYTENQMENVTMMGFEELVRSSDIVSFHVPLTKETRHMVKASTLEWFSPEALLINTSRGDVVCMNSLLNHLSDTPQFRVALDVFPTEPLPKDSLLHSYPNVTLSPHIGATTQEALIHSSQQAVQKLLSWTADGQTQDALPPQAGWAHLAL